MSNKDDGYHRDASPMHVDDSSGDAFRRPVNTQVPRHDVPLPSVEAVSPGSMIVATPPPPPPPVGRRFKFILPIGSRVSSSNTASPVNSPQHGQPSTQGGRAYGGMPMEGVEHTNSPSSSSLSPMDIPRSDGTPGFAQHPHKTPSLRHSPSLDCSSGNSMRVDSPETSNYTWRGQQHQEHHSNQPQPQHPHPHPLQQHPVYEHPLRQHPVGPLPYPSSPLNNTASTGGQGQGGQQNNYHGSSSQGQGQGQGQGNGWRHYSPEDVGRHKNNTPSVPQFLPGPLPPPVTSPMAYGGQVRTSPSWPGPIWTNGEGEPQQGIELGPFYPRGPQDVPSRMQPNNGPSSTYHHQGRQDAPPQISNFYYNSVGGSNGVREVNGRRIELRSPSPISPNNQQAVVSGGFGIVNAHNTTPNNNFQPTQSQLNQHNQGQHNQVHNHQSQYNQGTHNQGPLNQGQYNQGPHNQGPHQQGQPQQGQLQEGQAYQGQFQQGQFDQAPAQQRPQPPNPNTVPDSLIDPLLLSPGHGQPVSLRGSQLLSSERGGRGYGNHGGHGASCLQQQVIYESEEEDAEEKDNSDSDDTIRGPGSDRESTPRANKKPDGGGDGGAGSSAGKGNGAARGGDNSADTGSHGCSGSGNGSGSSKGGSNGCGSATGGQNDNDHPDDTIDKDKDQGEGFKCGSFTSCITCKCKKSKSSCFSMVRSLPPDEENPFDGNCEIKEGSEDDIALKYLRRMQNAGWNNRRPRPSRPNTFKSDYHPKPWEVYRSMSPTTQFIVMRYERRIRTGVRPKREMDVAEIIDDATEEVAMKKHAQRHHDAEFHFDKYVKTVAAAGARGDTAEPAKTVKEGLAAHKYLKRKQDAVQRDLDSVQEYLDGIDDGLNLNGAVQREVAACEARKIAARGLRPGAEDVTLTGPLNLQPKLSDADMKQ